METKQKGRGWLVGAVAQTAIGCLIVGRGCAVMASGQSVSGDRAGGALAGVLFGAFILFLGIRALRIYRRSRK